MISEKVRGMNASLAPIVGPGPLKERAPARLRVIEKRAIIGVALTTVAGVATAFTVNSMSSSTTSFPGTVTASKVYDLNFPTNGQVAAILVSVGQSVAKGQLLARQDQTTLESALTSAEGVLKADQAQLAQAQNPQLTPVQYQQDELQVQEAETALANAQANFNAALLAGRASVAQAQTAAAEAQNLVNADQSRYDQACPAGPVAPTAGVTGSTYQTEEEQFSRCQDLQLQLDKDQSALSQANGQISVVVSQANDMVSQDQAAVNTAQAALRVANYEITLQTSPTNPTAVTQAEAAVSQAQGQVSQAQQALAGATLVAPADAKVSEVYGAVGEYLGPDGVHQYSGPAALPNSSSPGFQFFPSATLPGGNATSSASQPLLELIGGQQQVTAEIPEGNVGSFHTGILVHVQIDALHRTVNGTLSSVVQTAVHTGGSVTYDAIVTLDKAVGGLLPGMSASIRL